MRIALLLTVAFISLSCTSSAKEPKGVSREKLRVMTFNIHHAAGMDGKVDLERIAAVIRSADPDVVALQEVDNRTTRAGGVDQAAELGRLTNLHVHFAAAFDLQGGEYGQAILSRAPIRSVNVLMLPRLKDEQRIAVVSEIDQPGGAIRFVATHLTHNDEQERVGQATALISALGEMQPMPTILAGDMNAQPDAKTIAILLEKFDDTTGDDALTWSATRPVKKIDWILSGKDSAWKVGASRVAVDEMASDHRAVIVELERESSTNQ